MAEKCLEKMTAICIHAHEAVAQTVRRHWRHYGPPEDRFGVLPEGSQNVWPENIPTLYASRDSYIDGCNLPEKLVATFEWMLQLEQYSDFFVTEYDSIIIANFPVHSGGVLANVFGPCPKKWKVNATWFLHPPLWADRKSAGLIAKHGRQAILNGACENGSPDVFLGWLCESCGIPFAQVPGLTFSCNGNDMRVRLKEAVAASQAGAWFIHGIREENEFLDIIESIK